MTILDIVINPDAPDNKYLVQSPLTCEFFYLSDEDLNYVTNPFSDFNTSPESLAPEVNFAKSVARRSASENLKYVKLSDRLAAVLYSASIALFFLLGLAMLAMHLREVSPLGSAFGNLFFPFGLFLLILPVFLLLAPVVQRRRSIIGYDRSRAGLVPEYTDSTIYSRNLMKTTSTFESLPSGQEKNRCWRCGKDNPEDVDLCRFCGANFNYRYIKKLLLLNTYSGILAIWSFIAALFLIPLMFGNSETGQYFKVFLLMYGLCFLFFVTALLPYANLAGFNHEQIAVACLFTLIPPLAVYYMLKQANENTEELQTRDLGHFRRNDGFINHWQNLDENRIKGIITAYCFDTGELFRYKPEKRIKLLKQAAYLDPLNHRILFHLAREYFARGEIDLGLHEIDNALMLFPANAQYLALKRSYIECEQPEVLVAN